MNKINEEYLENYKNFKSKGLLSGVEIQDYTFYVCMNEINNTLKEINETLKGGKNE